MPDSTLSIGDSGVTLGFQFETNEFLNLEFICFIKNSKYVSWFSNW